MKIYIVIPALNEEKRIGKVLEELKETKLPVVVIDDGSVDETFRIASRFISQRSQFTVIRHEVNLGKGEALKTGCDMAFKNGADAVIVMDSDGQHKVTDISVIENKLKSGNFDIVFGSRNFNAGMPFVRFLGNKIVSVLINLLFGIYVSDILCGFRGFTKSAYSKIKWDAQGYGIEFEMIARTGKSKLRFCEVPVSTVYYDKYKGVSAIDAVGIFFEILLLKIRLI